MSSSWVYLILLFPTYYQRLVSALLHWRQTHWAKNKKKNKGIKTHKNFTRFFLFHCCSSIFQHIFSYLFFLSPKNIGIYDLLIYDAWINFHSFYPHIFHSTYTLTLIMILNASLVFIHRLILYFSFFATYLAQK